MSPYAIGLCSDMVIMSFLALGAYLLLLVGRVSFGLQAFFGIGAYVSGIGTSMLSLPLGVAIPLAVAAGALISFLLAWPIMRLSGLHYAVATLAFGELARISLSWWQWQIPTAEGLVGPNGIEGFRDIRWLLVNNVSNESYFLLCLILLLLTIGAMQWLERRRLGVAVRMVGADDLLAQSSGLDPMRIRLLISAYAGGLAALGGALYAHRTTYIEPALFEPMLGVHAVGYSLIGGLGTAWGPLMGVVFDLGLLNATSLFEGWRMVVFGGLVAVFLRVKPRGFLDEAWVHRLAHLNFKAKVS